MKTHTNKFKTNIKEFGRELDSIITYTLNNEEIELGMEELNSVSPHYESNILKSTMKQLDIDSNVDIPLNTIINYQLGVKTRDDIVEDYRDNYDYVNFGNYVVYKSEKQEDTDSYKIICYDKMLYTMKDYIDIGITYPITIRNYINAICTHLGITFKNANTTFANYNREIPEERYIDSEGNSLGYTFRDVLDELAQVTASIICINEDDDELEIRYITDTEDTIDEEYLKDINVNFGEKYGPINSIVLSRAEESDNVYIQDEESIEENGLCELKIKDNQIMNFNDRSDYLPDILSKLDGLEYYINDFSSTGICYYNVCDRYNISIGENEYSCIMLNDEINVTQGLEENVHTDMLEQSETDYTKADKTDRRLNQTYIIADKANQQIQSVVTEIATLNNTVVELGTQYTQTTSEFQYQITQLTDANQNLQEQIDEVAESVDTVPEQLKNTLVEINVNGVKVKTNLSKVSTLMSNNVFAIQDNYGKYLTYIGYDETEGRSKAEMDNLTVKNYFTAGYHRQEGYEESGEQRTGWFYVGGGN